MKKIDTVKMSILSALTLTAYIPTFIWMVERWRERDTYYSHGFLVPLICVFIAWSKRERLKKIAVEPANIGWAFFIIGMAIHTVSALLRIYFSSGFSLLLTISGIILLFLGKKFLKELLFPISFLVSMIPLPLVVIANISFRLKIFASQISTIILNYMGIPAVREGSVIKTMHSYLMVEDPCSGIRSLIALLSLGAIMAYFSNISKPKKIILFSASMPIAIIANIIRIVSLALASEMYGEKLATGIFHDAMGILVFVFAFLGLSFVGKLLE